MPPLVKVWMGVHHLLGGLGPETVDHGLGGDVALLRMLEGSPVVKDLIGALQQPVGKRGRVDDLFGQTRKRLL